MTDRAMSRPVALSLLAAPALVLVLLLVAPIGYLLSFSFAPGGSMTADFADGPTLENYGALLTDRFYLGIIAKTVAISLAITLASLVIGWPLAYFIWRVDPRWKALATLTVVAPLLISIPVRNYGWMILLGDGGLINLILLRLGLVAHPLRMMFTDFAAALGLTHVLMPFVVLSVLASLERMPDGLVEAAETLGARRLRAIFEVALPLSMPGVLAGAVLVFSVAVSSYVTPALMGPSGARYSATLVYQLFVSLFDWPRGAALAAILLVVSTLALLTMMALVRRRFASAMGES